MNWKATESIGGCEELRGLWHYGRLSCSSLYTSVHDRIGKCEHYVSLMSWMHSFGFLGFSIFYL
ncbi:hypothetical protein BD410DRAFT_797483 [Rickenella mellea]|uniref:Uncharacterized protein n=1 Tax=Rickenella mellea TaxID=50990 RepID=A0A4Y7PFJ9_9AGAM|nr:hypothetical protein BD410DRAFT_797483 [Rickenella mellea]